MSKKNLKLAQIAEETLECVNDGYYINYKGETITIDSPINHSEFISNKDLKVMELVDRTEDEFSTEIEVTGEDSVRAIIRLSNGLSGKIGCLNFASGKKPGGGFLTGATAQEESLCRSTSLYDSIVIHEDFYDLPKNKGVYTDSLIYSPDISVFRTEDKYGNYSFIEYPSICDFITCAAVNLRSNKDPKLDVKSIMKNRIDGVLKSFYNKGCENLVLGAWGCGVFQNDPKTIAELFKELLTTDYEGKFNKVVFAIYTNDSKISQPFKDTFDC